MIENLPDIINGCYEFLGAPFIFLSIIQLYKDKQVKGINWIHVGFFSSWGFWNLFYYPHLEQWFSFIGGIALTLTNTFYLIQLIYYSKKGKNERNMQKM